MYVQSYQTAAHSFVRSNRLMIKVNDFLKLLDENIIMYSTPSENTIVIDLRNPLKIISVSHYNNHLSYIIVYNEHDYRVMRDVRNDKTVIIKNNILVFSNGANDFGVPI